MSTGDEQHGDVKRPAQRIVVAGVAALGVVGALCAAGFWLALYLESSGFKAPGNGPRLWVLVGYSAGLVAFLAIPLAAAVVFLRRRWWWALGAIAVGVLLALTTLGVG